ncbi:MAG: Gfo/Idh/MocA family oxidoreductase [Acidimicrobiales bacterium]|jgi:predicted dehydrogenase|nr:Gfo/Idh/MocA family oxidoreductase [Acidimicrobiales bacterium]
MRVAVVGIGYWGPKHVRVLSGLPEVSEVVCVDTAAAPEGSGSAGVRTLSSLTEALPQVDAVVVSTPPTTHAALALQAIRAGKHVLVEKPFTTSIADADELVRAAADAGVVLMAGHTYAFNGVVQRLREMIRNEELGHLHYLDSARLNLGLYRPDVSVVWDLAAHDVAIMNFLLDSTPDVVSARSGHVANPRFDDIAYLWLEYNERSVVAAVHVSWLDPCKVRRITVVGSERMAVYNDLSMDERLKLYDKGVEFAEGDPQHETNGGLPLSYRYGDVTSPFISFDEPLKLEDRHFLECVRTGATPLTDGRSGLEVVEVLAAVDESLRRDAAVHVAELRAGAR